MNAKTLRLGLVGPLPPPNGGMAMQTMQLARLLKEEGVHVHQLQTNSPYSPGLIKNVKGVRALFRLLPFLYKSWLLAGRVDVIHLMANSGWSWQLFAAPVIWIGWLRKTPVLVNYRGGEAREYLSASGRWVKPSVSKAASLVVPSGFLQEVFREFGISSHVIPNIIDLDVFFPVIKTSASKNFTVVVTRNLEAIYGLETAIRAIALVRKELAGVQLKIAGSGPQKEELQLLVEELNLTDAVSFLGRLDRPEIVSLYQSADAMLNPSTVDNMPNSVLEALACGVPVISSNVGGVPYIVRDGETAILVPSGNEHKIAEAVLRLYNDLELCQKLAKTGRQEVSQYCWARVKLQWLDLYNSCGVAA